MAKKSAKNRPKQPIVANLDDAATKEVAATHTTPLPTTTSQSASASQVDTHAPATTRLSFFNFLTIATTENIEAFLELAATTPEGANLERLWERAYEEGYEKGRKSLLRNLEIKMEEKFEEGIQRGMDLGREEGYTVAKEAFDEIIKVVKAREAPKVNTTSASTQTAATYTTISMQTDFNLSSSTSYLTSGTQTNHLHTNSCPTMDCFVQTNPSSIQTSCHIINSSSLSPTLPQVTATSSVSTTTMGIQTNPTTTQLLETNPPTCVATSQCPELPGNEKNAKNTKTSTTQVTASEFSQNLTVCSPPTHPVASSTSSTPIHTQNEHPDCPNLENATHFGADTPPSPALTSFEIGTKIDNEFENLLSGTISDHVATDGVVLGHDTSIKTAGFTQKHAEGLEPQKSPISEESEYVNWADDVEAPQTISTTPTKHPRDLSDLRSSSPNPFSSLRRRHRNHKNSHRFIKFRSQFNIQHPLSYLCYHISAAPHHCPQPHFPTSLKWDQDPRLADLSKALHALGWVRH